MVVEHKSLRQLRIKSGVVQRLTREITSYKREAEQQQVRLEKMKLDDVDEYDIMKMGLVVQESLAMVPHCLRKLIIANKDLEQLLDDFEETKDEDMICVAKKNMKIAKERIQEENESLNAREQK